MSEYINIISKEAVTAVPTWISFAGGIVPILIILSTFVYRTITEYEQFINEYSPQIKDNVYYFTAGEIE